MKRQDFLVMLTIETKPLRTASGDKCEKSNHGLDGETMKTAKNRRMRLLAPCFIASIILVAFIGVAAAQTQETTMALAPSSYTAHTIGEEFSINITAVNVQNLNAWWANIIWDQNVLTFVDAYEGPFLIDNQGNTFHSSLPKYGSNRLNDTVEVQEGRNSNTGVSGSGILATLIFTINSQSVDSPITLNDTLFRDPSSNSIVHQVQNSKVTLTLSGSIVANAGGDQIVNEDTAVVLNASRTYPQDENLTYEWSLMDRKPVFLNGMVVIHIFDLPGVYPINLTVTDSEGNMSRDSILITVKDTTLPTAIITLERVLSNQTITVGEQVTFSSAGSFDPENGTIVSYHWDTGTGTVTDPGQLQEPAVLCEFNQTGTFNVSLTVTEDGGNNGTATFTITIRRASDPLDQTNTAILAAITVMVLVCSPDWLLHRRKH